MLRHILIILSITILAGCSEMKVIGDAAMRELKADGMSVERISYEYHQKLAAREKTGEIMVAKAEKRIVVTDGRIFGEEKKMGKIRVAKAKRVKGLWETH
jgi:hypothetical protein